MNKDKMKLYMRQERELRKKHTDMQMKMIVFGLIMFMLVLMCMVFAFAEPDEGSMVGSIFPYLIMEAIAFKFLCESFYFVDEKNKSQNKSQNTFVKMRYVPRNMKEIFLAKALVMIKDMGTVVIITQLITVLINIPYNGGRFVVYRETFAPLYLGAICMLSQLMMLCGSYRVAVSEEKYLK